MILAKGTFTTYPAELSRRLRLDPNEQVTLLWICHYTNQDGVCWPSLRALCSDTGMSLSTVRRAIGGLAERGVLRVTHRKDEQGGNSSNIYEVLVSSQDEQGGVSQAKDPSVQADSGTKSKKELKDIPQLIALASVWTASTGGVVNLNRYGGELLKLINATSLDSVANALRSYCAKTQPKWRRMSAFIENPCIEAPRQELDFERL